MRIRLITAAMLLTAGCASQPEAPAPAAAVAQAQGETGEVRTLQAARIAGYKIVNEKGQTLYCREQLKTGSNLRKETICLTGEELEAARAASKRNLEQMQRRTPPPHGT